MASESRRLQDKARCSETGGHWAGRRCRQLPPPLGANTPGACEEVPSRPRQADNSSYVHLGMREALSSGRAGCGGPCPRSLGKERFHCLRVMCVWVWPMAPVCLSQCAHAGLAHLWKVCLSRPVAWASFVSGVCIRLAARVFLCFGRVWSIMCSPGCICLWGTSETLSCVERRHRGHPQAQS